MKKITIDSLYDWQNGRGIWLLLAVVCLALLMIAHSIFQHWLFMKPCEQCVYIRFGFFVIVLGCLIAMIQPTNNILKAIAYVFSFYGMIQGIIWSYTLNKIHIAAHGDNPFGVQGCSTEPHYPFGLRLENWSPDWFMPTGDCGFDNPFVPDGAQLGALQQWFVDFYADGWYLWPASHFGNMAVITGIAFFIMLVVLSVFCVSWLLSMKKQISK